MTTLLKRKKILASGTTSVAPSLARVQATPVNMNAAAATTIVVSFSTPPVVGHGIVVAMVAANIAATTGCTDNRGNTYTQVVTQSDTSASSLAVYLCSSVGVTGSPFSVTVSGVNTFRSAVAIEYNVPLAVDRSGSASGASPTATVGSLAALTADKVAVVGVCSTGGSTFHNVVGSGWTIELEDVLAQGVTGEVDSKVLSTATGLTLSESWGLNGAHFWACALVALKSS